MKGGLVPCPCLSCAGFTMCPQNDTTITIYKAEHSVEHNHRFCLASSLYHAEPALHCPESRLVGEIL